MLKRKTWVAKSEEIPVARTLSDSTVVSEPNDILAPNDARFRERYVTRFPRALSQDKVWAVAVDGPTNGRTGGISKFAAIGCAGSRGCFRYVWHDIYMAALFEADKRQMPARIAEAERILAERERELFLPESNVEERRAVTAALHALSALRTCLGLPPSIALRAA